MSYNLTDSCKTFLIETPWYSQNVIQNAVAATFCYFLAMSEDKARRPERGSTYVEDIDTYMYSAHRNSSGKLTIEYRNNDMILFDPTLYQKDNGQVVKFYDAASSCKDSAFYSDGSDYGIKPGRTIFLQ